MWAAAATSFVVLASCRLGQYRHWWFLAWGLVFEGGSATWVISAMALHNGGLLGVVVLMMGLALVALAWIITPRPFDVNRHGASQGELGPNACQREGLVR